MSSILGNCSYSNIEIVKLFITEWNSSIYPTYNSDMVTISSYNGLTNVWREIETESVNFRYSQKLIDASNGKTFEESISIIIQNNDMNYWNNVAEILTGKYVVIFIDANDNYWTLAWRYGAKVVVYSLENNQFSFNFISNFSSNLLTGIESTYVINNIIR